MSNIFWGCIFILLNFTIYLGTISIGLLPDFVGYILLGSAMKELYDESQYFQKLSSVLPLVTVFSVIEYVLEFFAVYQMADVLTWVGTLIGVIDMIVWLYVSYYIAQGVLDMEAQKGWDINGENIYSVWKILVVTTPLAWILGFVPLLNLMAVIANLIVMIVFLVVVHTGKRKYEESYLEYWNNMLK